MMGSKAGVRLVAVCLLGMAACTPQYNWREIEGGGYKALLPCKPDRATKNMELLGELVSMEMTGCEAGDGVFAIVHVRLKDGTRSKDAQAQWQAALLENMRATAYKTEPWSSRDQNLSWQPIQLRAQGQRADGQSVKARAVWLARGMDMYHAVVYANKLPDETVETFFSGIEPR